jgi:hypothetical protein
MPNGETEVVSHRTKLPYSTLSNKAREAHVLPAIAHHSLLSISTLANKGYTTIFHAGAGGAEAYKANDISFYTKSAPVLQGCRKGQGLWTVTTSGNITKGDTINNVYGLPSMAKAIHFMHAAQRQVSPSSQPGSKPSNKVISTLGHCSRQRQSSDTIQSWMP